MRRVRKSSPSRRKPPRLYGDEESQRRLARERADLEAELAEREAERLEREERVEEEVLKRLARMRIDHEARRRLTIEVSRQKPMSLPKVGWTADDFLADEEEPPLPVVRGLHYEGNNTLLVAEFKTGKTTLEINLARSLVDGTPFLGRFEARFDGNIAFLNYEMDRRQFRQWLEDSGIVHVERVIPLNLRGWTLPFWDDKQMYELAEWLLGNGVRFLILDPAARAWRGLVDDENDNMKVSEFFGALDELKRLANCPNLLLSAHTPRAGADRARGSGEIEAWPDGNWYLGKVKGLNERSFRAEGRDVLLEETLLTYDEPTRTFTVMDGDIHKARIEERIREITRILQDNGTVPSMTKMLSLMKGRSDDKREALEQAQVRGLVRIVAVKKQGRKYSQIMLAE